MNAPANELIGLIEIAPVACDAMRVEERGDRVPGASTGTMIIERSRAAGQACGPAVHPPESRLRAVVHVEYPVGQLHHRRARSFRSRQKIMKHQPCRVVVLV